MTGESASGPGPRSRARPGWLAVLLAVAMVPDAGAAPRISAEASSREVRLGETFSYSVVVSDLDRVAPPEPDWPEGLELIDASSSSQYTIVNGRATSETSRIYRLRARKEGTFTIPSLSLPGAPGVAPAPAVTVKVVRPGPPSASDAARREERGIFYLTTATPAEVYQGEPIAYWGRVYLREGFQHVQLPQAEAGRFEGFRADDAEFDARTGRWVSLATGRFSEFTVEKKLLVPIGTGNSLVLPGDAHVMFERSRAGGGGQGSIFRSFFRDFSDSQRGKLPGEVLEIPVRPLPEAGKPPDFKGLVGRGLGATVSTGNGPFKVGEPVQLRIELEGGADLRGLSLDHLVFPGSVVVFETKGTSSLEWQEAGPVGKAAFDFVLVPNQPGRIRLPDLDLPWFDAASGRYQRLLRPGPEIEVTGTAVIAGPVRIDPGGRVQDPDDQAARRTLRFLREDVPEWTPRTRPLHERTGPRLLLLVLGLLAVLVEVAARRAERFAGDALGLRAARARSVAMADLAGQEVAAGGQTGYGELARILREYVAAKARRPAASLASEDVRAVLEGLGADPVTAERGAALLARVERGRFSGDRVGSVSQDRDQVRAFLDEVEGILS